MNHSCPVPAGEQPARRFSAPQLRAELVHFTLPLHPTHRANATAHLVEVVPGAWGKGEKRSASPDAD